MVAGPEPLTEDAIDWSPHGVGIASSGFTTHRLTVVGESRLELRGAPGLRFLVGIVAGFGAALLLYAVFGPDDRRFHPVPAIVGGAVFLAIGCWMWRRVGAPLIFDRVESRAWRGRGSPQDPSSVAGRTAIPLADIGALQILVKTGPEGERSFELNLALVSGERVQVVDHVRLRRIQGQADVIARFLGVPLYDRSTPAGVAPESASGR